jgi:lysophospholipase L1-like esterase
MKKCRDLLFALAILTLPSSHAQTPAPISSAYVLNGVNNAVEKDQSIQAHGKKGWRLEQATVTDTNRPRVLLIGDSILNGYQPELVKLLDGKAYVDAWINPYWQSKTYNELLAKVLDAAGPYDIVHFNTGLHGHSGRVKPQDYDPLTREFLAVIRRKSPHAKLIWANITPVTVKKCPKELDPVINANIQEQNRMASVIMKDLGIPTEDFYGLLVNRREELAAGDGFHWKAPAYTILANSAAESIGRQLEGLKHSSDRPLPEAMPTLLGVPGSSALPLRATNCILDSGKQK